MRLNGPVRGIQVHSRHFTASGSRRKSRKYEEYTNGWIFWAWKSQLGDYRWTYQDAVAAGVIPGNIVNVNQAACNVY